MRTVFSRTALLGLLLAACSPAVAPAATAVPDAVRKPVEAYYTENLKDMVDPEQPDAFKIAVPPAMYSRIDVNGDGIPDWKVDYEKAQNASFFCGTGGCLRQIYVSHGGTHVLAFERTVREFKLGKANGERILDIDFHGSTCGGAGVEECPRRYAWDTALGRFIERPNKKGDGWLEDGPSPVVTTPLAAAPAEVRAQIERRVGLCKAIGGGYRVEDGPFNDLPDLNGDGVRDWVVGTSYDTCDLSEAPEGTQSPLLPVTIMVSKDGGFVAAWEGADQMWGVDLLPSPRFMTLEGQDGCRFRTSADACKRAPWRWDGSKIVRMP